MEPPSDALVIASGGWHPRYARVLLSESVGEEAIVLVDGNGDGAEVEAENWEWDGHRWVGGATGGIGPLDGRPVWTWGELSGTGFVIGCAEVGEIVLVEWGEYRREAVAGGLGIWMARFPERPEEPGGSSQLNVAPYRSRVRTLTGQEASARDAARPRVVAPDGPGRAAGPVA